MTTNNVNIQCQNKIINYNNISIPIVGKSYKSRFLHIIKNKNSHKHTNIYGKVLNTKSKTIKGLKGEHHLEITPIYTICNDNTTIINFLFVIITKATETPYGNRLISRPHILSIAQKVKFKTSLRGNCFIYEAKEQALSTKKVPPLSLIPNLVTSFENKIIGYIKMPLIISIKEVDNIPMYKQGNYFKRNNEYFHGIEIFEQNKSIISDRMDIE